MGVWMSFGLNRKGGNTVVSNQDNNDAAVVVRTDDNNPELFNRIILQLRLLNTRFEEAFRTNVKRKDVETNDD